MKQNPEREDKIAISVLYSTFGSKQYFFSFFMFSITAGASRPAARYDSHMRRTGRMYPRDEARRGRTGLGCRSLDGDTERVAAPLRVLVALSRPSA